MGWPPSGPTSVDDADTATCLHSLPIRRNRISEVPSISLSPYHPKHQRQRHKRSISPPREDHPNPSDVQRTKTTKKPAGQIKATSLRKPRTPTHPNPVRFDSTDEGVVDIHTKRENCTRLTARAAEQTLLGAARSQGPPQSHPTACSSHAPKNPATTNPFQQPEQPLQTHPQLPEHQHQLSPRRNPPLLPLTRRHFSSPSKPSAPQQNNPEPSGCTPPPPPIPASPSLFCRDAHSSATRRSLCHTPDGGQANEPRSSQQPAAPRPTQPRRHRSSGPDGGGGSGTMRRPQEGERAPGPGCRSRRAPAPF